MFKPDPFVEYQYGNWTYRTVTKNKDGKPTLPPTTQSQKSGFAMGDAISSTG
jgi:hypothetical protein